MSLIRKFDPELEPTAITQLDGYPDLLVMVMNRPITVEEMVVIKEEFQREVLDAIKEYKSQSKG